MGLRARSARIVTACVLIVLAPSAWSAPAAAAPKPITGTLSEPGSTVVALAENGQVTSVRATRRRFRLRPPAERVTLHLRAASGVYAGPIVVRRDGRLAILGVRAGARLGQIRVREGYASLSKRLRRRWIDSSRRARARRGVPIGAGVFGRIRSRPSRGAVPGDLDLDGIPDPLDIDDDGDRVLDTLDRSGRRPRARAAQGGCGPAKIYCPAVSSVLNVYFQESANANAGSTTDEIDALVRLRGVLKFDFGSGPPIELDCAGDPAVGRAGLRYCSPGGTGIASAGDPAGAPFPGTPDAPPGKRFDGDGDGFGVLDPELEPIACGGGCPGSFFLLAGARARRALVPDPVISEIGSGDQFLEHVATDGDTSRCPDATNDACVSSTITLDHAFATPPTLLNYSDTAGHSATVTYPRPGMDCSRPGCPFGPGTGGNGFPVSPGPDGQIRLRFTFWRPQRRALPGSDPGGVEWMDVGRLTYGVETKGGFCPQTAFAEDDANLTVATPHLFLHGGGGFDDGKGDEQSSPGDTAPGRTFTYTLNLSSCLADLRTAFGDEQTLTFIGAPGAPSFAAQSVDFRLASG